MLLRVQSVIRRVCRDEHVVCVCVCVCAGRYDRIIINGDKYLTKDAKVAWLWPIHMKQANPAEEGEGRGEGCVLRRTARLPWTINDIGAVVLATIAGFSSLRPVCPLLLLSRG